MGNSFKINKNEIRKMSRELEREFAKHPVRVPIHADPASGPLAPAATVVNYNGPVVTVTGDNAQVAWGNESVDQSRVSTDQIAPGYEHLARAVTDLLANLGSFDLTNDDARDLRATATDVLGEVVKEEPDTSLVRRGLLMIKGLLAPVAAGIEDAATEASAEAAKAVLSSLAASLPF